MYSSSVPQLKLLNQMFTLKVGLTVGSLTLFLFLINKTNLLVIGVCCECTR